MVLGVLMLTCFIACVLGHDSTLTTDQPLVMDEIISRCMVDYHREFFRGPEGEAPAYPPGAFEGDSKIPVPCQFKTEEALKCFDRFGYHMHDGINIQFSRRKPSEGDTFNPYAIIYEYGARVGGVTAYGFNDETLWWADASCDTEHRPKVLRWEYDSEWILLKYIKRPDHVLCTSFDFKIYRIPSVWEIVSQTTRVVLYSTFYSTHKIYLAIGDEENSTLAREAKSFVSKQIAFAAWLVTEPIGQWLLAALVILISYLGAKRRRAKRLIERVKEYGGLTSGRVILREIQNKLVPLVSVEIEGKKHDVYVEGTKEGPAAALSDIVNEAACPGSIVRPVSELPKGLVSLVTAESDHVGMAVRVGNSLITASHVFRQWTSFGFESEGKPRVAYKGQSYPVGGVEIEFYAPIKEMDLVKFRFSGANKDSIFSCLGVSTARFGEFVDRTPVWVYGPKMDGSLGQSAGIANYNSSRLFGIHHQASTFPGWSGSPIYQTGRIVGIHLGAEHGKPNRAVATHLLGPSQKSSLLMKLFTNESLHENTKKWNRNDEDRYEVGSLNGSYYSESDGDMHVGQNNQDYGIRRGRGAKRDRDREDNSAFQTWADIMSEYERDSFDYDSGDEYHDPAGDVGGSSNNARGTPRGDAADTSALEGEDFRIGLTESPKQTNVAFGVKTETICSVQPDLSSPRSISSEAPENTVGREVNATASSSKPGGADPVDSSQSQSNNQKVGRKRKKKSQNLPHSDGQSLEPEPKPSH
jgi:hypothetical protein